MEDDWDLQAVVRSCSSSTTTAATAAAVSADAVSRNLCNSDQDCNFSWFKDSFGPRNSNLIEDLHDLWKPFFPKQQTSPIYPSSNSNQKQEIITKKLTQQKQQLFSLINAPKPSATSHNPTPRSKKRKHHSKKVCHVAAESLSSDMWSWRKYGQKPIKGSPYPRGYYRCSTSKGCMARKQVERNRSDPGMFIVTYTGDHTHPIPTHRNSLAGSTRRNSDDSKKPSSPPPPPPEDFEEDDDDLFAGLEDFAGDFVSEPWLGATAAAGGG